MNQAEIAAAVTNVIGRKVTYQPLTISQYRKQLAAADLPEFLIQHFCEIAIDYQNGIFSGEDRIITEVTGKAPMTVHSVFELMRKSGHQNDFYMFAQMQPDADQIWADAAVTIPGVLYWASGSAPADKRWSPMDPARSLYRPAPGQLPSWTEPDYVAHNVTEFQRTGFHGGLNYYRAAEPYFYLSGAWKCAKITQPSFYIAGKEDGLKGLFPPAEKLRAGLPGIVGNLEIDNVGHWVQHEASAEVGDQLVKFLRTVNLA